jgi:hypothetical protein
MRNSRLASAKRSLLPCNSCNLLAAGKLHPSALRNALSCTSLAQFRISRRREKGHNMKRTRVRSERTGALLEGANAKCYNALKNLWAAERKVNDDLQADIERKAAELETAAELKAADEYKTAKRKPPAAKYRAAARKKAKNYENKVMDQAMRTRGKLYEMSDIAAERKLDELLLEAIDEQNGDSGHLGRYLWAIRAGLEERLNKIGLRYGPCGYTFRSS